MNNVISIKGDKIKNTGKIEPNEDVIGQLEEILEEAKKGNVQGMVAIMSNAASELGIQFRASGTAREHDSLLAGLTLATDTYIKMNYHQRSPKNE